MFFAANENNWIVYLRQIAGENAFAGLLFVIYFFKGRLIYSACLSFSLWIMALFFNLFVTTGGICHKKFCPVFFFCASHYHRSLICGVWKFFSFYGNTMCPFFPVRQAAG